MTRILLVGTVTLDLVFRLDHYPAEDEEMRAQSLRICRGGNAANTAVVLAGLGHAPDFLGVLADARETVVIEQDFSAHGVDFYHCPRLAGRPPTSSIYISGANRSIVHYRDLPELDAVHFTSLDLKAYGWVHFEGRNVEQLGQMLAHARSGFPGLPISLELEKPRDGIQDLLTHADLLLCSRGFSRHHGFDMPQPFLRWIQGQAPKANIVAAWGEAGAYAIGSSTEICHAPAKLLTQARDTLGAGDTFNAAIIDALAGGLHLQSALARACELAGKKCGVEGFDNLNLR
jgi:ketohexokinase